MHLVKLTSHRVLARLHNLLFPLICDESDKFQCNAKQSIEFSNCNTATPRAEPIEYLNKALTVIVPFQF